MQISEVHAVRPEITSEVTVVLATPIIVVFTKGQVPLLVVISKFDALEAKVTLTLPDAEGALNVKYRSVYLLELHVDAPPIAKYAVFLPILHDEPPT